jgi:ribonuclease HI
MCYSAGYFMQHITVFTDGGARGNPGPAAIGAVFYDAQDNIMSELSECIGDATNNVAEYTAIVRALETLGKLVLDTKALQVTFKLDSQLVQRQMTGEYKVKDETLKEYHEQAKKLIFDFDKVIFIHVPRSENKEADRLVNEALDA